jgi:hypothetical protein
MGNSREIPVVIGFYPVKIFCIYFLKTGFEPCFGLFWSFSRHKTGGQIGFWRLIGLKKSL